MDRDQTDAAKSYEELLNKVKGYARQRNGDNTAQKNMQNGSDPVDVGSANGDRYEWPECRNDDTKAVGYCGYKGNCKRKSRCK